MAKTPKRPERDQAAKASTSSGPSTIPTRQDDSDAKKHALIDPKAATRTVVSPARKAHEIPELSANSQECQEYLQNLTIYELTASLPLHDGMSEEERNARILRAYELYEGLAPKSAAEAMLAMQMVNAYFAAMECMRRAARLAATPEEREMNLSYGARYMAVYNQLLNALDRHRGKLQPQVAIGHVHVNEGGQAIVGTVDVSLGADGQNGADREPIIDLVATKVEDSFDGTAD